jgi:signal transduction histidine kinase
MHAERHLPHISRGRLIAFSLLGEHQTHERHATSMVSLLNALAQTATNALDTSMLLEDLHRSHALMKRTDRLRSLETIAGGFAHEIRNPLTSIKTFIQLAPERKDDPDFIREFSRIVLDDVYRIERLIEEILDYARYMEPKLTEEDVNDIVSSCLYFIEVKADSRGIKIEKELMPELPRVMLDRQQIKQVFLNLFLNALDAMSEGGGTLRVRTRVLAKPGGKPWIQIETQDTGQGIPEANLEHIFDPFFTTKHESGEHEGTGLGLTIVHQIIQDHYGEIQVKSATGRGTTFFVNLPATPS